MPTYSRFVQIQNISGSGNCENRQRAFGEGDAFRRQRIVDADLQLAFRSEHFQGPGGNSHFEDSIGSGIVRQVFFSGLKNHTGIDTAAFGQFQNRVLELYPIFNY